MTLEIDVAAPTDAAPHWRGAAGERLPGLGRFRKTNTLTWLIARAGGLIGGGRRVKLLEIMGSSGALALAYAPFGLRIVVGSKLSRVDCELATLRTAWNVGARYEWHHHVYAARFSGLSLPTVERVTAGPEADGWSEQQRLLLRAVDDLHAERVIAEPTFQALAQHLSHAQLVDLCMLVGHYEMLAMTLNTFGIEPEPETWRRGPLRWVRDELSGDGITPARLAGFNRRVTNPITRTCAGKVRPYSVIHHEGRKSGKPFVTPVVAHYDRELLIVPLLYGSKSDWVRNVIAAGGGQATYRHRTRTFTGPRVVDAADAVDLPDRVRRYTRLVPVLIADLIQD
ncbi:nitroreductase family deazaflavin-dependent oxidoreductase [Nocardia sp. NPDC020380]|uniref:nitroreductase family deazaflavin-dependent oxidoreductase n=1 Tax=Nocardia sp. NPDC020380 TaxID=3364309 RepID=UPI0037BC2B5D